MANNENNNNNDTSTQNSKFVQLNSSLQILNESINIQITQFRQKVLKTIYSKDPVRRKQIACRIYINDLDSVPGYKVSKKQICRICICEEETSKFIAPCKCKGTSEFVHQECLKMWILEQQGVNKIYNDEAIIFYILFSYTVKFVIINSILMSILMIDLISINLKGLKIKLNYVGLFKYSLLFSLFLDPFKQLQFLELNLQRLLPLLLYLAQLLSFQLFIQFSILVQLLMFK
ncbi:unnamed protein product [Paramecium sonneborni]|uniref:RING-CH-type domain-containing protein n=1 Tax=Paramecium sonneborni TaxID=65129 RepID=A0A8S1LCZ5_9CILI|nr:unnamed protein product [Paramecium sonneborni]